ncbi:GHMP kinase [Candidatus Poribacteria bacterium]|nr:GHMP kinase [Candidatus Poribacteria bacterium]MYG05846.1 GHMP kinase [Candidatus Poribacteria bacterium]MYK22774.1 GHMP kinase [Candidatus Poribacteria bacterium]
MVIVERNEMARAYAPGNISCVFKVIPHADPARMHSLGMGFTVKEGVEVTVSEHHEMEVLFNGACINFPTVRAVVNQLTQNSGITGIKVDITSPLPLGCGFGLSGAAALATAYALNELLTLHKNSEKLAMAAHIAEVENRTGLGDVCSQYHGGCLVKLKEGSPLTADRLPIAEQQIYYRYFGPIQTSEVLGNREQTTRINRAADVALRTLQTLTSAKPNANLFNACFAVSKQFSVESGLLSDARVIDTIADIEAEGGVASMIMLGNGVFSTHSFKDAVETRLVHNPARLIS